MGASSWGSLGLAVESLAHQGRVDADQWLHFRNVPIGTKSQRRARIAQTTECPRILPPGGANRLCPLARNIRGAMSGLHASDYAHLLEARDIPRIQALDMDQLIPSVAWPVLFPRILNRIQRCADSPVTDGMDEDLEILRSSRDTTCLNSSGG